MPGGSAHPAIDEVAKNENNNRSVPTCFKSYHIGSTVCLGDLLVQQGDKPYSIFHTQRFKYTPKYLYKNLGLYKLYIYITCCLSCK